MKNSFITQDADYFPRLSRDDEIKTLWRWVFGWFVLAMVTEFLAFLMFRADQIFFVVPQIFFIYSVIKIGELSVFIDLTKSGYYGDD